MTKEAPTIYLDSDDPLFNGFGVIYGGILDVKTARTLHNAGYSKLPGGWVVETWQDASGRTFKIDSDGCVNLDFWPFADAQALLKILGRAKLNARR